MGGSHVTRVTLIGARSQLAQDVGHELRRRTYRVLFDVVSEAVGPEIDAVASIGAAERAKVADPARGRAPPMLDFGCSTQIGRDSGALGWIPARIDVLGGIRKQRFPLRTPKSDESVAWKLGTGVLGPALQDHRARHTGERVRWARGDGKDAPMSRAADLAELEFLVEVPVLPAILWRMQHAAHDGVATEVADTRSRGSDELHRAWVHRAGARQARCRRLDARNSNDSNRLRARLRGGSLDPGPGGRFGGRHAPDRPSRVNDGGPPLSCGGGRADHGAAEPRKADLTLVTATIQPPQRCLIALTFRGERSIGARIGPLVGGHGPMGSQ